MSVETTPSAPTRTVEIAGRRPPTAYLLNWFIEVFGVENGLRWCANGKTYAEAIELHRETLEEGLAAAAARVSEIEAGLAALDEALLAEAARADREIAEEYAAGFRGEAGNYVTPPAKPANIVHFGG